MESVETQLKILREQMDALRGEIAELRRAAETVEPDFNDLRDDAVVGKDYVAHRFGCSVRAVLNGLSGTRDIPRVSRSPLKFVKRDVDAAFAKQRSRSLAERAADIRQNAKPRGGRRLLSIVGKQSKIAG